MITSSTLLLGAWSCMYVKPLQTTSKAGRQARMHAWCMARFSHAFACPSSNPCAPSSFSLGNDSTRHPCRDPAIRPTTKKNARFEMRARAHTLSFKKKEKKRNSRVLFQRKIIFSNYLSAWSNQHHSSCTCTYTQGHCTWLVMFCWCLHLYIYMHIFTCIK